MLFTENIQNKIGNLLSALRQRGIDILEIKDNTVSLKLGAGVYQSHKTIRKRIYRKDGIKYEKTVDPHEFGFKIEDRGGLVVFLIPSWRAHLGSSFLDEKLLTKDLDIDIL